MTRHSHAWTPWRHQMTWHDYETWTQLWNRRCQTCNAYQHDRVIARYPLDGPPDYGVASTNEPRMQRRRPSVAEAARQQHARDLGQAFEALVTAQETVAGVITDVIRRRDQETP